MSFEHYQDQWWDPEGPLWTLHRMNRMRASWFSELRNWHEKKIIDVGCGAGLFSDVLISLGAEVSALDFAQGLLDAAASAHQARWSDPKITYLCADAASWEGWGQASYDALCAFEVLEHLEHPERALDRWLSSLRPGGDVFLSSPNRGALSFAMNIVAAEHLLSWVPVGTHHYHDFIALDDLLGFLHEKGLVIQDIRGLMYYPGREDFGWSSNTALHYTVWASLPA